MLIFIISERYTCGGKVHLSDRHPGILRHMATQGLPLGSIISAGFPLSLRFVSVAATG